MQTFLRGLTPPIAIPDQPGSVLTLAERCRLGERLARRTLGLCETPAGSNGGPWPDFLADYWGEPRRLAWCARHAGFIRRWARTWTPAHDVGSCDAWRDQAERAGKWVSAGAMIGDLALERAPTLAVVLYTTGQRLRSGPYAGRFDAVHATLLCAPPLDGRTREDIGGNTSRADGLDSNGGMVCCKPVVRARLYGIVLP